MPNWHHTSQLKNNRVSPGNVADSSNIIYVNLSWLMVINIEHDNYIFFLHFTSLFHAEFP